MEWVRAQARDDQPVTLRGYLSLRPRKDHFLFTDKTGKITVEIKEKKWPNHLVANEKSLVEISGEYDKEDDKIEVDLLSPANGDERN